MTNIPIGGLQINDVSSDGTYQKALTTSESQLTVDWADVSPSSDGNQSIVADEAGSELALKQGGVYEIHGSFMLEGLTGATSRNVEIFVKFGGTTQPIRTGQFVVADQYASLHLYGVLTAAADGDLEIWAKASGNITVEIHHATIFAKRLR